MDDDLQALAEAFDEMLPALELIKPAMQRGEPWAVKAWKFYGTRDATLAKLSKVLQAQAPNGKQ